MISLNVSAANKLRAIQEELNTLSPEAPDKVERPSKVSESKKPIELEKTEWAKELASITPQKLEEILDVSRYYSGENNSLSWNRLAQRTGLHSKTVQMLLYMGDRKSKKTGSFGEFMKDEDIDHLPTWAVPKLLEPVKSYFSDSKNTLLDQFVQLSTFNYLALRNTESEMASFAKKGPGPSTGKMSLA